MLRLLFITTINRSSTRRLRRAWNGSKSWRPNLLILPVGANYARWDSFLESQALRRRARAPGGRRGVRSEEHTSELQSLTNLVCRLLLETKKQSVQTQSITSQYGNEADPFALHGRSNKVARLNYVDHSTMVSSACNRSPSSSWSHLHTVD